MLFCSRCNKLTIEKRKRLKDKHGMVFLEKLIIYFGILSWFEKLRSQDLVEPSKYDRISSLAFISEKIFLFQLIEPKIQFLLKIESVRILLS